MSIPDTIDFDKDGKATSSHWGRDLFRKLFLSIVVVLVGWLGFGLGRLSRASERPPMKIEYDPNIVSSLNASVQAGTITPTKTSATSSEVKSGVVYASSKGTKYYYAHCRNTISTANKISFPSSGLAEAAGYTLAANCKP